MERITRLSIGTWIGIAAVVMTIIGSTQAQILYLASKIDSFHSSLFSVHESIGRLDERTK